MRIVLVSNSQGTNLGLERGDNYPVLLRSLLPEHELHLLIMSAWSIRDFNESIDNVIDVEPDLVVAQIGIIECGRRILSTAEKRHLAKLGRVGWRLSGFLHDRRPRVILLRRRLGIDTRLFTRAEFESELARFVTSVHGAGSDLLLLEVPHLEEAYEREHFPLMNDDIATFNPILRKFGAVPVLADDDDLGAVYQPGTIHFNALGHRLVAERVAELVRDRMAVGQREGLRAMQ